VATFEAIRTVPAGVPVDTGFRLASLTGEDAVALAAGLSAEPALEFAIARADDGAAIVTPVVPLRTGTLYRFTLSGDDGTVLASWPVETVRRLWIAHSIPGKDSDAVYPWSAEGQQVRWCVARRLNEAADQPITYVARVLTAGTYTWEPAVLQSALAPDHGVVLPASTVTIRGFTTAR
jgi:hypothetical protein